MPSDTLPGFVIIGAVKGATTWLHHQLQHHPDIFLPAPEPHYFSQDYERGLDYYRGFFSDAREGQLIGEKSADYLAHPDAARRLADVLPEARLVVQLRDPVARAYSDYKMLYRRGTVREGPERYLHPGNREQPRFLEDGLYARHLERWLEYFASEQLAVLLFEDVKQAPVPTVHRICRHIGAREHYADDIGTTPQNDSSDRFLPMGMRLALAPLKQAVRPLRGNAAFEGMRAMLARAIDYPAMTDDLRDRLRDYYADDVSRLERIIGRDLSAWKPHAEPATGAAPIARKA
ncbi:sulfotransferase family protein [Aurantiacibacter spongiae]|uniref:Sulfotransferase n=1 Tax=Aurantiacibacter spongiae TaxID=2488860 RepID=A0A3N5CWZ0_9SPHN|nr:sulfotransferase [Aurantiacibacter spongiae]RPF71169.1 sulfotransferase [Aurantiacibacter spongiae]